jgi:hypothetical protein
MIARPIGVDDGVNVAEEVTVLVRVGAKRPPIIPGVLLAVGVRLAVGVLLAVGVRLGVGVLLAVAV